MLTPALHSTEKNANRMEVLAVRDLQESEVIQLAKQARRKLFGQNMPDEEAKEIYDLVGGRPSVLSSLAKRKVTGLDRCAPGFGSIKLTSIPCSIRTCWLPLRTR